MTSTTVHRPTSTAEVSAIIRELDPLRIRGGGHWMEAGQPVRARGILSLESLRGIGAYTPGDLTISVGAATTLAELDAATAPHGQWCPLLPWGDDAGTVGATIATATAGPFAAQLGRPRDLVLGVEAVDGTGRIIAAGGRVVKNVAGFDLTRAFTGSWGTLAALTHVHLRLRARPAIDESWCVAGDAGDTGDTGDTTLHAALHQLAQGPYAPLGLLALTPAQATTIGVGVGTAALVRLGGNRAFVDASLTALRALGACTATDPTVWDRVRGRLAPPDRTSAWRWDALSTRLRARFDPSRILNPGILGDPA